MSLISVFLQRRLWILSHSWLSELALSLLLPVALYLAVAVTLGTLVEVPRKFVSFQVWVAPGIIFIVVMVSAYFPLFIDIFQNRRLLTFFESVSGSPNTPLSITSGVIISLLPEVVVKGVIAALVVQLLTGHVFPPIPFIGFLLFAAILGFLILNFALTLSLIARRPFSHLFSGFVLLTFVIFASGWVIPLDMLPSSISPIFSALPTAWLAEGGRALIFDRDITLLSWSIPLLTGLVWTLVNTVIFARVNSQ